MDAETIELTTGTEALFNNLPLSGAMLSIEIDKAKLVKSLSHLQNIVDKRTALQILSYVKIEASDNKLIMTTTDLEIAITLEVEAKVQNPAIVCVPVFLFAEVAKKMPAGSISITIEQAKPNNLTVKSGDCIFEIPVIPVNDFPIIDTSGLDSSLEMEISELGKMIERTKVAVSDEETRYYLTGIYFHFQIKDSKNMLVAAATDCHRLAVCSTELTGEFEEIPSIIMPRKALNEISKLAKDFEGKCKFYFSKNKIKLEIGNIVLISKLIDGNFPQYQEVIPKKNKNIMKVGATHLAEAVDRVSVMSSDKIRGIKFIISDGSLSIYASDQSSGTASEKLAVEYKGDSLEIGFNYKYVLEMISVFPKDISLDFAFNDNFSSCVVTSGEISDTLFVLMPMRF